MIHATQQHTHMLMIDEHMEREASWVCVTSLADALRRVHANKPRAVLVQIDSIQAADACLGVLEELHRRWPQLALIVLSSRHDDQIERSVRGSGAHCYMHGEIDLRRRLGEALAEMDVQRRSCRDSTMLRPPEARSNGPPRRVRA